MNFKDYIKENIVYIILTVLTVISCEILLIPSNVILFVRIYVLVAPILVVSICFFAKYYTRKKYYDKINKTLDGLQEKYLIAELLGEPNFADGIMLKETIQEIGKSMHDNVNLYKHLQEEYKDYIELWIHEIKLPISVGKMIIENNKSKTTKSINEELDKIENYVEQALYYARSQVTEKDYYIKKQNLKDIVNTSIIKNKNNILQNGIKLDVHDIDEIVYTDSKWLIFILNQIIQNSIQYSKKENRQIEIYSKTYKEKTSLHIKDNGIGIKQGEVNRVFEKGFTGGNGRINGKKSTGIGLYLCKKLCDKLGLGIKLYSEENVGTEVKIVLPKSSFLVETLSD